MISALGRVTLSAVAGILAGAVSLLTLSTLHWLMNSLDANAAIERFYINEITEEIAKFLVLLVFFDIFLNRESRVKYFLVIAFSIIFGLGFGVFEGLLIFLSGIEVMEFLQEQFVFLSLVHITTSVILGIAASLLVLRKSFLFASFLGFFAIILHIYYNIFALNFN